MAERLTKRLLDDLSARETEAFIWDTDLKGFGVRVWPSGRLTFVAKYRVGGGRTGPTPG